MRALVVVALVAAVVSCGSSPDECTQVKDKVRPLLEDMARDAGKALSDDKREELLAEFCPGKDASESERKMYRCLVDAKDRAAAAACLQAEFEAYAKPAPRAPRDAAPVSDAALVDAAAVAVADAAVDAAPAHPAVTPIDPQTLPAWPAPKVAGRKPPVDVYAVDMDSDRLLLALLTDDLLMLPTDKKLTGRISAPSREAAFAAVAAQLGIDPKPPTLAHREPTVNIDFARAPGLELLRVLADVGHVNVVAVGALPELDIRVKRKSWDSVLARIAALTGHTVTASGSLRYVLPAGTKLPPLPKVASRGAVTIDVNGGTIGHAVAALRAITDVPLGACDSPAFDVRVRKAPLAEALRALSVASGAALAPGDCKATKLASPKLDDLRLVAIAGVGDKRAAAFDRKGEIVVATKDDGVVTDIGEGFVTVGQQSTMLYRPTRQWSPDPVASWRRTAALLHTKDGWTAFVETDSGYWFVDARIPGQPRATVDERGVHADNRDFPLGR